MNVYRSINQVLESIECLLNKILRQLDMLTDYTIPPKGELHMVLDPLLNKFLWDWVQAAGGITEGFRVLWGTSPGDRSNAFTVVDPAARSLNMSELGTFAPGTYFAVVVAFNSAGNSSASNEVTWTVVPAVTLPVAPTNFRIELI